MDFIEYEVEPQARPWKIETAAYFLAATLELMLSINTFMRALKELRR